MITLIASVFAPSSTLESVVDGLVKCWQTPIYAAGAIKTLLPTCLVYILVTTKLTQRLRQLNNGSRLLSRLISQSSSPSKRSVNLVIQRLNHMCKLYERLIILVSCLDYFVGSVLLLQTVVYMVLSTQSFIWSMNLNSHVEVAFVCFMILNSVAAPVASLASVAYFQVQLKRSITTVCHTVQIQLCKSNFETRDNAHHVLRTLLDNSELYETVTCRSYPVGFRCALVGFPITWSYLSNVSLSLWQITCLLIFFAYLDCIASSEKLSTRTSHQVSLLIIT